MDRVYQIVMAINLCSQVLKNKFYHYVFETQINLISQETFYKLY